MHHSNETIANGSTTNVASEWESTAFSVGNAFQKSTSDPRQSGALSDLVLKVAWAIVVRAYTGLETLSFSSIDPNSTRCVESVEFTKGCSVRDIVEQLEVETADSYEFPDRSIFEGGSFQTAIICNGSNSDRLFDSEIGKYKLVLEYQLDSSRLDSRLLPPGDTASSIRTEIQIHYRRSHFDSVRVSSIIKSFQKAITAVINGFEQSVAELDLISDSDREKIVQWNKAKPPLVEETVDSLIKRQVLAFPNAHAVTGWDRTLTYKDLDDIALRLAAFLVDLGVGPDVLVPFCFDKSALAIVVILGVLKSGGAYVALDPSFPDDRISAIISNAKAPLVLSSASYAPKLKAVIDATHVIDFAFLEQLPKVRTQTWAATRPADLAYAIFTSGTSGTPKGILIENKSLSTMALTNGPDLGISKASRVLQFASYTFDASVMETIIPLVQGGCVHVPSEHERLNDLAGYMHRNSINWTFLTPTVAALLQPKDLPTLKNIHLGGEAPRQDVFDAWRDSVAIHNLYGPSECTVMASFCEMVTHMPLKTIGHGKACRLWIVDRHNSDRLCPIGACGELVIEGHIVGRGYINDSNKTQASFIERPSWLGDHARAGKVYKTGDLVMYNLDGSIVYLGRKDNQIKLHGLRMEIGDIETHVAADEFVQHNAVMLPKTGHLKNKLVCVLSLKHLSKAPPGSSGIILVDAEDHERTTRCLLAIKQRLNLKLPVYMIPTTWIVVKSLPLTSAKKIDQRAIQTYVERLDSETVRDIFSTETGAESGSFKHESQKKIVHLLAHVLNIPQQRIKPHSSFFSLGGDSITAMQLVAKCRAAGVSLKVKDIMKSESIADMAGSASPIETTTISKRETFHTPFGLTPIQRLYFERIRDHSKHCPPPPFTQAYLIRFAWRVSSEDVQRALNKLVERHSILGARYCKDGDGNWRQLTVPFQERRYHFGAHEVHDKSAIWPLCAKSHDLVGAIESGPLFAADYFNVGNRERLIFFVAHHLVVDIMSWRIIFRDLETFLTSDASLSPPLPFQIWTTLQEVHACQHLVPEKVLLHNISQSDFGYWGMINIPNVTADVASIQFNIDMSVLQLLFDSYRHFMRADPIDIYIAGLLQSFNATFTDRDAPALYTEGHGREPWDPQLDVSETVGWFTALYPLQVQNRVDFDQLVLLVKDQRTSVPNKGYSYFTSRYLNPAGRNEFAHHADMEVNLNYTGHYQQLERRDSLLQFDLMEWENVARNQLDSQPRLALFEIDITVLGGKAYITNSFNKKMKYQALIAQWMSAWERAILTAVSNLQQISLQYTPGDFPMASLTSLGVDKVNEIARKLPKDCVVEDLYPCSPVQQGMLLAQARSPDIYKTKFLFKILPRPGPIDLPRLHLAWEQVIRRHSILRTVIIDNISHAPYDQMVLSSFKPQIQMITVDDDNPNHIINVLPDYEANDMKPSHQLTFVTSSGGKHYLGLSISHALFDATSRAVLTNDLELAYDDKLSSRSGPKYRKYIQYLQSNTSDDAMKYWKTYLKNVNSTYFPRLNDGIKGKPENKTMEIVMTEHITALNDFCRAYKITVANVFLVVWGLVLRMINNADQINFGYLTSGREIELDEVGDAIGPYINMLICRMDIENSSRLIDLVEKRRDDYLESLPYQHAALADIQHSLKLSKERLFNTALSFQRAVDDSPGERSISIEQACGSDPSEYDINVHVGLWKYKLLVHIKYTTSVLSVDMAPHIANMFKTILAEILHSPQTTVGDLSPTREQHLGLLQRWNLPEPVITNCTLHGLIAETVARYPTLPALQSVDEMFNYVALDSLSTKVAHYLVSEGVQPGSFVPICVEKSNLATIFMVAILKAGGAFVPIDPNAPQVRIKSIINSIGCGIALCTRSTAKAIKGAMSNVVVVSKSLIARLPEVSNPPQCNVSTSSPAYIMFTSGSTGEPKGVVIEHRAISSSLISLKDYFHFGIHTRFFQFTTYTFDGSLFEIFATLVSGGCVCSPTDDSRLNDIPRAIRELDVNTAFFTPSVLRLLEPDDVPELQLLLVGGEAIGSDNVETWAKRVQMHCIYGPTEASIWCVCCQLGTEGSRFDIIGQGVGVQTWVVLPNNHDKLAPIGCIGELVLSGPGLAREYLNNEERTTQAFIEDPSWLSQSNTFRRIYKTGDLVRYNSNGSIFFLGRKDTQTKLRGQRLEFGEIEHHLKSRLHRVQHLAVDVIAPGGLWEKRAIAVFMCLRNNIQIDLNTNIHPVTLEKSFQEELSVIKASLAGVLPSYMIPLYWIGMSSMPRTTSGKLDRKILVEIGNGFSSKQLKEYSVSSNIKRSPSTDMQKKLHCIWQNILGIPGEEIGTNDNFFQLGGDSILAMKLATAATRSGISINVSQVFQTPVLSAMADLAEKKTTIDESQSFLRPFELLGHAGDTESYILRASEMCHVQKEDIADMYPCTPVQENLMNISIRQPGAYMMQQTYRLDSSTDPDHWKAAWQKTVDASEILRTRIVNTDDHGLFQVVLRKDSLLWGKSDDLAQTSKDVREKPINYGEPLIRYNMIYEAGTLYFIWTAHHSIYDGWSLPLVFERFVKVFRGEAIAAPPPFSGYIAHIMRTGSEKVRNFWATKFLGEQSVVFPRLPSPNYIPTASATVKHNIRISTDPVSGVVISNILRASWAIVASRYSESDDTVFGATASGRTAPVDNIEGMLGPTMSTFPVRVRIDWSKSAQAFLEEIQKQASEMIPFEHFGLQNIARQNDTARAAVGFQTLTVVQPVKKSVQYLGAELLPNKPELNVCSLLLEFQLQEEGVDVQILYDPHVLAAESVEVMAHHFEKVLRELKSHPERQIGRIDMFSKHDQQKLEAWNKSYTRGSKFVSPAMADLTADTGFSPKHGLSFWITQLSDVTRLAPVGVVGELLIGAPSGVSVPGTEALAHCPEWLPQMNDFAQQELFETGYAAQFESNGDIKLLGKKDAQALIKGRRIDLAMVERHLLKSHQEIRRVSVHRVVFKGRQTLVAILELQRGDIAERREFTEGNASGVLSPTPEIAAVLREIQKAVAEALEHHVLPSLYIPLEEIPPKINHGWLRGILSSFSPNDLPFYTINTEDEHGNNLD